MHEKKRKREERRKEKKVCTLTGAVAQAEATPTEGPEQGETIVSAAAFLAEAFCIIEFDCLAFRRSLGRANDTGY